MHTLQVINVQLLLYVTCEVHNMSERASEFNESEYIGFRCVSLLSAGYSESPTSPSTFLPSFCVTVTIVVTVTVHVIIVIIVIHTPSHT